MLKKILHLYWGKNRPLSYFRSLTVTTFRKLNPDWDIRIWVPKTSSRNVTWRTGEHPYIDVVDCLSNLKGIREFDFGSIGIDNDLPEVHKSDLLRWYLLGTQGGVWADFDIIFVGPITEEMRHNWKGAGLCQYEAVPTETDRYQAIGFLTSSGLIGKRFFSQVFEFGKDKNVKGKYQGYGAELLDDFLLNQWKETKTPFCHDPAVVYHYHYCRDIEKYFKSHLLDFDKKRTIGLHWFGGNPGCAKNEAKITSDNLKTNSWAICREASRVLYPEMKFPQKKIKYSFLMPYYKRSSQLESTLASFKKFYNGRADYEIIIANDLKSAVTKGEDDKLMDVIGKYDQSMSIRLINSGAIDVWNPAAAFQKMSAVARGEFFIITNPECVHRKNILDGLDREFEKDSGVYVVCSCFSIPVVKLTPDDPIPEGHWYQHSKFRDVGIHFCTALHRETYEAVDGFDQEYSKGMGFDDDDFRNRLAQYGVRFVLRDDLLTVHLAHPGAYPPDYLIRHSINKKHYEEIWGKNSFKAEAQRLGHSQKISE